MAMSGKERTAKHRERKRLEEGREKRDSLESAKNALIVFEESDLKEVDEMVKAGAATSRSSFVREAVSIHLKKAKKRFEQQ